MTRRWLPKDEWDKLAHTPLALFAPYMDEKRTKVVVVEHEGEIIGCWAFMFVLHAEGLWKTPGHDRAVWKLLGEAVHEAASEFGVQAIMTGSTSETVTAMIERNKGEALPAQFSIRLPFGPWATKEAQPCQP